MNRKLYKTVDELPACLKVSDVASVLNISRQKAYELVKVKGFPHVMVGTRIVVPKTAFLNWLDMQVYNNG
jgi:excisionase family DNA binding protein